QERRHGHQPIHPLTVPPAPLRKLVHYERPLIFGGKRATVDHDRTHRSVAPVRRRLDVVRALGPVVMLTTAAPGAAQAARRSHAVFAAYMLASAARTSSSAPAACCGRRAVPTLAETVISTPCSRVTGSSIARRTRSATTPAARRPDAR